MNYKVNFEVLEDDNGYKGFGIEQGIGYFEPGWDTGLMFHDIFEHWFENTNYFSTNELSQAGECVALGIRSYLDDHSGLISSFASYNKYQGNEWNTWNTIIGQVAENLDKDAYIQYPNDFNYTTLSNYKPENLYEGYVAAYCKEYYKLSKKLSKQIEMAVSYGYWLGEQVHSKRLNEIYHFMTNLKLVWSILELNTLDMYDDSYLVPYGSTLTVEVGNKITARLHTPEFNFTWSNETTEEYIETRLSKKLQYEY